MTCQGSPTFEMDLSEAIEIIKTERINRVLLQFPSGLIEPLSQKAIKILQNISSTLELYTSADVCFGACDLAINEAKMLQCELLIHFGHSDFGYPFNDEDIRVVYIPITVPPLAEKIANQVLEIILERKWKKIAIFTTIQHLNRLNTLISKLSNSEINILSNKTGKPCQQILGCLIPVIPTQDIDAIVCVAGGNFHVEAIQLRYSIPILHIDPFIEEYIILSERTKIEFFKKRYAQIYHAKAAKKWGILIGVKSGQYRPKEIALAKKWLDEAQKTTFLFTSGVVNPTYLENFVYIDAWIFSACSRLSLELHSTSTSILTIQELAVVLGKLSWEKYVQDPFVSPYLIEKKTDKNQL
ncbi:MAG: diphthamide synthesis protein [Candidatus Hermodarchaeota archaeon]